MARGRTVGAMVSVAIETPAGGMAVGKRPRSRSYGECRDRNAGWRDGCRQDSAQ